MAARMAVRMATHWSVGRLLSTANHPSDAAPALWFSVWFLALAWLPSVVESHHFWVSGSPQRASRSGWLSSHQAVGVGCCERDAARTRRASICRSAFLFGRSRHKPPHHFLKVLALHGRMRLLPLAPLFRRVLLQARRVRAGPPFFLGRHGSLLSILPARP